MALLLVRWTWTHPCCHTARFTCRRWCFFLSDHPYHGFILPALLPHRLFASTGEWCLRMQEKLSIKGLSQRVTYTCAPVDRGTGGWGVSHAFEEGTYRVFKAYVDAVTALNESVFDVVLIDGRARVACALKVLPYLNDDSLVLLHDARREKYAPILNYYDPLGEVVGTYGVRLFRRKRGIEAQLPLPDDAIHAAYDNEGGKAQTAAAAT